MLDIWRDNSFHALLATLGLCLLLSACAWVEPTTAGAEVQVAEAAAMTDCRRLGTTRVAVLDRVAGIPRSYRRLEQELDTLARNSAARMGGDHVVAETDIVEGERTYVVYDCSRPPREPQDAGGAEVFPLR